MASAECGADDGCLVLSTLDGRHELLALKEGAVTIDGISYEYCVCDRLRLRRTARVRDDFAEKQAERSRRRKWARDEVGHLRESIAQLKEESQGLLTRAQEGVVPNVDTLHCLLSALASQSKRHEDQLRLVDESPLALEVVTAKETYEFSADQHVFVASWGRRAVWYHPQAALLPCEFSIEERVSIEEKAESPRDFSLLQGPMTDSCRALALSRNFLVSVTSDGYLNVHSWCGEACARFLLETSHFDVSLATTTDTLYVCRHNRIRVFDTQLWIELRPPHVLPSSLPASALCCSEKTLWMSIASTLFVMDLSFNVIRQLYHGRVLSYLGLCAAEGLLIGLELLNPGRTKICILDMETLLQLFAVPIDYRTWMAAINSNFIFLLNKALGEITAYNKGSLLRDRLLQSCFVWTCRERTLMNICCSETHLFAKAHKGGNEEIVVFDLADITNDH